MVHHLFQYLAAVGLVLSASSCSMIPAAPATTGTATNGNSGGEPEECNVVPLFPVKPGATWTYNVTSDAPGAFTRTLTSVEPDNFTQQDAFSGGATRTIKWDCEDGLLADQPDAVTGHSAQSSGLSGDFRPTDNSGVTVPDNLGPSAFWNQDSTIEGAGALNGQTVPVKNHVITECTAGNMESITVPAGKFEALRADCKTQQTVTATLNGVDVPTDISSTTTVWYAPAVGMVRTEEVTSTGARSIMELASYKLP